MPGPGWRRWSRRGRPEDHRPGAETHDRLQDFLDVYDELNENIDTFVDRKSDLRKVLKVVIDGDTEFQAKLRALRDAASTPKKRPSNMSSALELRSKPWTAALRDHRQLLTEQEEAFKHKKPAKP